MSTVVLDISMSLDGFVTASNPSVEEPLGPGGQRLHEWVFGGDEQSRELLERAASSVGAIISGRRNYDLAVPWWGPDGPGGPARLPVFVITHRAPAHDPHGGVYTFVTDGIDSALAQARAAAGGKIVAVMGGADIGRQFLRAGLLDEISIHLVPVLLGSGTRLFGDLESGHVRLAALDVISTPEATHLRYRVDRP
jgi:dihydrofolate reductase